jgi:hypothetical protein
LDSCNSGSTTGGRFIPTVTDEVSGKVRCELEGHTGGINSKAVGLVYFVILPPSYHFGHPLRQYHGFLIQQHNLEAHNLSNETKSVTNMKYLKANFARSTFKMT